MAAEKLRVPDLWLKHRMVMALLPNGSATDKISNKLLAECVHGDRSDGSAYNKMIAGDDAVSEQTDLFKFAALFEYLIVHGVGVKEPFSRESFLADFLQFVSGRRNSLSLWPNAIRGTFNEFAVALLELAKIHKDRPKTERQPTSLQSLVSVIRECLFDELDKVTDASGEVKILHGQTRDWVRHVKGKERIVIQQKPGAERAMSVEDITAGHYVQFVIPSHSVDQLLFGFELRTDEHVITDPWATVGGWFSPRFQPKGEEIFLLEEFDDENSPRIGGAGEYSVQIFGIDCPFDTPSRSELPTELSRLIDGSPLRPIWPDGYAESTALITYLRRLSERAEAAKNGRRGRGRPPEHVSATAHFPPASRARLYQGRYRVK